MDAPLIREEYTGEVIAALFKQQRLHGETWRIKSSRAFLQFKYEDDKPRTDTVVRHMVNADPEVAKLHNRKVHADQQVSLMRMVLGTHGVGIQEGEDEDDD